MGCHLTLNFAETFKQDLFSWHVYKIDEKPLDFDTFVGFDVDNNYFNFLLAEEMLTALISTLS